MRDLKFSTSFPVYHPRKGEETFFVNKICLCDNVVPKFDFKLNDLPNEVTQKLHTARAFGLKSLKKGDFFIPKFWSGRPYGSTPVQFAEPIQVLQTHKFEVSGKSYKLNGKKLNLKNVEEIARNDGLTLPDFQAWFAKSKNFEGQIICWEHVY